MSKAQSNSAFETVQLKIADLDLTYCIRKEFNDIAKFAKNIEKEELLHPITVCRMNGINYVAAGRRRIAAHKELGKKRIEAKVKEVDNVLQIYQIQRAENRFRKDLTDEEAIALLEDLEKAQAVEKLENRKARLLGEQNALEDSELDKIHDNQVKEETGQARETLKKKKRKKEKTMTTDKPKKEKKVEKDQTEFDYDRIDKWSQVLEDLYESNAYHTTDEVSNRLLRLQKIVGQLLDGMI